MDILLWVSDLGLPVLPDDIEVGARAEGDEGG
jgi:hypothetical protein